MGEREEGRGRGEAGAREKGGRDEATGDTGSTLVDDYACGTALAMCEQAEKLDQSDPRVKLLYTRALERSPGLVHALNGLGRVATAELRHDDAIHFFTDALRSYPQDTADPKVYAAILTNRSNAWFNLHKYEEAISDSARAVDVCDTSARAWYVHARNAFVLENYELSEWAVRSGRLHAIFRSRTYYDLIMLHAFNRFILGDWENGWRIWRERSSREYLRRCFHDVKTPEWNGEDVKGKRVLVYGEDGLGDQIMFARWLPLLTALGADVYLAVPQTLLSLFAGVNGVVSASQNDRHFDVWNTHDAGEGGGKVDYWVGMQDLPLLLGEYDPAYVPLNLSHFRSYETVRSLRVSPVDRGRPLRVGIAWHGAASTPVEPLRPSSLSLWEPLAALADTSQIEFYNLQVGEQGLPQFRDIGAVTCIADTARVIGTLDLVITADTMHAHLAASIGVPTWMLLYRPPEWRWGKHTREKCTPWYPNMQIFRQAERGKWEPVFARVVETLKPFLTR